LRIEPAVERRRAVRRIPGGDEPVSQVRLRAGRQLTVIDLSDTGLLAQGDMRLLPGTHVEVHLVTADGRLLVRSRVVRAFVCRVSHDRIEYRGALAFERPIQTGAIQTDTAGYPSPEASGGASVSPGKPYPERALEPSSGNAAAISP
jgi:hypothetical protein